MEKGPVSQFITHHYRHFNAAALIDAAKRNGGVDNVTAIVADVS